MTQPGDGIDMRRSSWQNPEGFQPTPRVILKAPDPDPVCGHVGPDGWVCDLKPDHRPANAHKADDGTPAGVRWVQEMVDVSRIEDSQPVLIPGRVTSVPRGTLEDIAAIARGALESPSPADWVLALDKIISLTQ